MYTHRHTHYTNPMAATFARLNKDELQFTRSGSVFASIATDVIADTITFAAAGGVGELYLNGVKTPTANLHAANKAYVDSVAQGLDIKSSVQCATAVNLDLATQLASGAIVDDFTVSTGDRVLVKKQTLESENGIYVVNAAGAPSRSADLATGARAAGAFVFVESGTLFKDSGFVCTTDSNADTVDTGTLQWTAFSGAGAITAGVGISKNGTELSFNGLFGATSLSTTGNIALGSTLFVASGTTGDVSINTDKFQIAGASGNTGVGGTLAVQGATTLTSTCDVTGNFSINTDKLRVNAVSGNTDVGGTLTAVSNFAVGSAFSVAATSGDCSASSYISTSDRTLKQDIESIPIADALLTVLNMRAVTFAFIAKPEDPRVGVIAQEMQEAAPALVKTVQPVESSGRIAHLAVNYGDLTAYLIGAIQALHVELASLRASQPSE